MNWPNRLTIFRIVLVPVFITLVLYHRLDAALAVFFMATITDALDGYLARTLRQKTKFGAIMDPVADKLLNGSAYICFSMVAGLPGHLKMPIYVPMVVISRDIIILIGVIVIYILSGKVNIRPTVLGKITTCLQMITIITVLLRFPYSVWIWNTMAVFTVISGIDYIRIGSAEINGRVPEDTDSMHSGKA